jgi:hypothetical protein
VGTGLRRPAVLGTLVEVGASTTPDWVEEPTFSCLEAELATLGGGMGVPQGGQWLFWPQWKMRVAMALTRLPSGVAKGPLSTMVIIS